MSGTNLGLWQGRVHSGDGGETREAAANARGRAPNLAPKPELSRERLEFAVPFALHPEPFALHPEKLKDENTKSAYRKDSRFGRKTLKPKP
eukprot:1665721-Rhodomonas_salina.1